MCKFEVIERVQEFWWLGWVARERKCLCVWERELCFVLCCVVLCLKISRLCSLFFQPPLPHTNKATKKLLIVRHSFFFSFFFSFYYILFFFSLVYAINPSPDPFNFSFFPIFVTLPMCCFSNYLSIFCS